MFGLDKKNNDNELFDLESEFKSTHGAEKINSLKQLIKERVENIKSLMRSGENKEAFEKSEILLNGYNALQQVIDRFKK
jgi:hypothetical protein